MSHIGVTPDGAVLLDAPKWHWIVRVPVLRSVGDGGPPTPNLGNTMLAWDDGFDGVVSLLAMLRLYADDFIAYFRILHNLEMNLATLSVIKSGESASSQAVESVHGNVEAFTTVCEMRGLLSATAKCKRIIESMNNRKDKKFASAELHQWLVDLRERSEDDLSGELFLHLSPEQAKGYLGIDAEWLPVVNRFQRVRHDVEECSKCFALERYGASLFHVLLIAEFGVIEVAKIFNVEGDKPGWGALDRLHKIYSKPWNDKTIVEQAYAGLLDKSTPLMLSIKNEWRHKINHVDNKLQWVDTDFSPQIAARIITATKGFMDNLTKDLPM